MTRELATHVVIDHSDRLRAIPDTRYNRDRSIFLRFLLTSDGYLVQAWGSAFPETGGGGYQGRVLTDPAVLRSGIEELRATWHERLIGYVRPETKPRQRPFVDEWTVQPGELDSAGLALAQAGQTMFALLFVNGDDGLKEICELMLRAMRSAEQVITIESDQLFVPWGMLYVPQTEEQSLWSGGTWTGDGFWGYRHLVEHNFARSPGFDSRITPLGEYVTVGLNIDPRVDQNPYPPTPYITPIVDFFSGRVTTAVRATKAEFAAAMQNPAFNDDILFFGCHGTGGDRAHLILGDDLKIYSGEFIAWLAKAPLPTRPVVFVGACQGGQLASAFYPTFGHHLLHRGARCLIGPQIDLPRAFAREYATRLFTAFLTPGTKLGDIVRDLARQFLDEHHNPLGLIFSLYRGIDVHLTPDRTR